MIAPIESSESSNSGAITQFTPTIAPGAVEEKVVLIVGGANGIGASLVEQVCQNGGYVSIGDIDAENGFNLARKCRHTWPVHDEPFQPPKPPRSSFQHMDITNYQAVLELFDNTFKTYKRIDHVVVTAGCMVSGNWFTHSLNMQTVREEPCRKDLDINLIGCMYVTRIASVYLRHNRNRDSNDDRSILLFSCTAGFKETPGVCLYQAAKHGVQGVMRSLRPYLSSHYKHNLRINTICPWMTGPAMEKKLEEQWTKEGLPISSPDEVAAISLGVLADDSLNGRSMYVEGGRAWEIEANIERLEPQWLGEEASKTLAVGQKLLNETLAT